MNSGAASDVAHTVFTQMQVCTPHRGHLPLRVRRAEPTGVDRTPHNAIKPRASGADLEKSTQATRNKGMLLKRAVAESELGCRSETGFS